MNEPSAASGTLGESPVYSVRAPWKSLPHALAFASALALGQTAWAPARRALRLEGTPATVAWLTLAIAVLVTLYAIFLVWFFLARRTRTSIVLGERSLRFGDNGRVAEYPFSALTGLRCRIKSFGRWDMSLVFRQGKVEIPAYFGNLRELTVSLFRRAGQPVPGPDSRSREFAWRVLRSDFVWDAFSRNWWKTALVSSFGTAFGKVLAEASPATDTRIDLWLSFNVLFPILAEWFAQRLALRRYERLFRAAPGMEVSLPAGYGAAIHRKVFLYGFLIYLLAYFLTLSDLALNS